MVHSGSREGGEGGVDGVDVGVVRAYVEAVEERDRLVLLWAEDSVEGEGEVVYGDDERLAERIDSANRAVLRAWDALRESLCR